MSHIFEVYPAHSNLPTFAEVVNLAEVRVNERMAAMGHEVKIKLRATLRTHHGKEETAQVAEGPFRWPPGKETYAWFEVVGIDGGCDVTYSEDRDEIEVFRDEIKYNKSLPDEFVDRCLDLGRRWAFRRSAGQPCVVSLVYGYVAAAFAELTEGFIYSDDGAWDRDMMPMGPAEFYATYFYPEKTREHAEWAQRCLRQLETELRLLL
jgi:hypothetical protein